MTEATIANYVPFVRRFLDDCFGNGKVTLSRLRAADVVRFVQRQAPHLHLKHAKLMTTALRSFLRYACYRGDTALDLAAAVPVVANWSMPSIPRAISPEQTRELLASIDRRTAVGRRDYAILLVLARLGLRSGEVVFLELGDIDWDAGRLTVRAQRWTTHRTALARDVGKAIAAYLRHGRPMSISRRVFLRAARRSQGFVGQVESAASFGIHFSAPALTHPQRVHISSATDWLPRCYSVVRRSARLAKYWDVVIRRPR